MNLFFNRFDQTPTLPLAQSSLLPPPPSLLFTAPFSLLICSTGTPQRTVRAPFLLTLYTSDFYHQSPHCHLQVLWRLCYHRPHQGWGRQSLQRTLWTGASGTTSSSTPARPKSWWWISAGTNNPAHRWTSWEQTLRWWHLTSTWEFTWTINWTGLITLQQHIRKVRADCICWGSSGPLGYTPDFFLWLCGSISHFLWSSLLEQHHLCSTHIYYTYLKSVYKNDCPFLHYIM